LKLYPSNNFLQSFETKIKSFTDYIVVPESAGEVFRRYMKKNEIITYAGFKEDVYIADFQPDSEFNEKIPFEDYVVLRPEALSSLYVDEKESLVSDLLNRFNRENINVVYLPRDKEDFGYVKDFNVFTPKVPLNGLDLCYYSNVVLTGSGTMAREASCLGVPSVSFFPGKKLLSVDKNLISENKMFHSRDPEEIVEYVLNNKKKNKKLLDFKRSKKVKNEVVKIIKDILYEN
jgi:predicted glycosyltransferase